MLGLRRSGNSARSRPWSVTPTSCSGITVSDLMAPKSILLRTSQIGAHNFSRWTHRPATATDSASATRTSVSRTHALLDGIVGIANAGSVDHRHRIAVGGRRLCGSRSSSKRMPLTRPSETISSRWGRRRRRPPREPSDGFVDFVNRRLKRISSRLKKCLQRLPLLWSQGVVVDRIHNICSTHGFIPCDYPDMKNGKIGGFIIYYREVVVKRLPLSQIIVSWP
jgi:hypothetical protein